LVSRADERIEQAARRRDGLLKQANVEAVRLFHDRSDGIQGLVIEKYGPVLIVQIHEGRFRGEPESLRAPIEALCGRAGARAAYLKRFPRDRARPTLEAACHDPVPWIGEQVEPELVIREHALRLLVRPFDGYSVGLFLEHRDSRRRIGELAGGRRVLNCFSYTCAFSVAAALAGAAEVTSIDLSGRYLEWGRRNFTLNGLDTGSHQFYETDVFDFFARAHRQGRRYDLVILDPPTFSRQRRPRRVFVLQKELPRLLAGASQLLNPGGILFFSTNDQGLALSRIHSAVAAMGAPGRFVVVERPGLPEDFRSDRDYSKTLIARHEVER
jgi:23S rRNA (cytosine1962-C5)-methyltransferase